MLAGLDITLLVGGSIAAYKSAELVRELVKHGSKVHVVMSESATKFISPLTLQTLSGNLVTTNLFDEVREAQINHIWLADKADVILAAPATADFIAKAAAGMADDALTTILLATKAPVIIAPAMNVNMWQNPVTQRNVSMLRERGFHFVDPEEGELACGWIGQGRLAEIDHLLYAIQDALTPKDLTGTSVFVTAGPTREAIDPIRFISNRSSGKMGYAIARAARLRGAKVSLIAGPTALPPPPDTELFSVTTAREMRDKLFELVNAAPRPKGSDSLPDQLVFMVAAVTDHAPANPSRTKVKNDKSSGYALDLIPSPDILTELGEQRSSIEKKTGRKLKVIGFSAETGEDEWVVSAAADKLKRKKADLMVANSAEAFERDTNRVWLLDKAGRQEEIAAADKFIVAARIVEAALRI